MRNLNGWFLLTLLLGLCDIYGLSLMVKMIVEGNTVIQASPVEDIARYFYGSAIFVALHVVILMRIVFREWKIWLDS